ncbi:unnamed protein product [Protopolystoma xenopodis]|uniref:Uncharacterized protein n=1 Tax=Protopolystoma xenopodis TaxID=117903 RepID=A0A448WPL7_9PLAT|nr:unnamed protein product [Protopolystoma xenopodis]
MTAGLCIAGGVAHPWLESHRFSRGEARFESRNSTPDLVRLCVVAQRHSSGRHQPPFNLLAAILGDSRRKDVSVAEWTDSLEPNVARFGMYGRLRTANRFC